MARRLKTRAERQAETRAHLLEAATNVFARRGYDAASVAEIAEEAGYTHGAVYSNFDGKEGLFLTLYEEWVARRVEEIETTWEQADTLAGGARAAADEWLERVQGDPNAFLLRLEFAIRAARDPDLRRKLGTRVGAVPLAIVRLVEKDGVELRVPAGELALGLQALSLGLALQALNDDGAVRRGVGGELAARLVEAHEVGQRR
jgi:AcrR family transcriptional regulator